jgi:hypothetical protein
MAQPPFKIDALAVEPGSGQTLTVDRDAETGSLRFRDTLVPSGLLLKQLAGLGTVTGVSVVGRSGSGAQYTSIQAALTAVAASASLTAPHLILVLPGVYTETLTWTKNGIYLVGLGRVVVTPATNAATLTVQAAVSTAPRAGGIRGIIWANPYDGQACISLVGGTASVVAADGFVIEECDFAPSGVGAYTVLADTINTLTLRECRAENVPGTTVLRLTQCASVRVVGGTHPAIQADYISTGSIPAITGSTYEFFSCRAIGTVQSTLTGAGAWTAVGCSAVGAVTLGGNRSFTWRECRVGAVVVNGTATAIFRASTYTSISGVGVADIDALGGVAEFSGDTTRAIVFDCPRATATYRVFLDSGVSALAWVSVRTTAGFTVAFGSSQTTSVRWRVEG